MAEVVILVKDIVLIDESVKEAMVKNERVNV